jgi:hypothetical protein
MVEGRIPAEIRALAERLPAGWAFAGQQMVVTAKAVVKSQICGRSIGIFRLLNLSDQLRRRARLKAIMPAPVGLK